MVEDSEDDRLEVMNLVLNNLEMSDDDLVNLIQAWRADIRLTSYSVMMIKADLNRTIDLLKRNNMLK